jgi:hypothetical protein
MRIALEGLLFLGLLLRGWWRWWVGLRLLLWWWIGVRRIGWRWCGAVGGVEVRAGELLRGWLLILRRLWLGLWRVDVRLMVVAWQFMGICAHIVFGSCHDYLKLL